MKTYTQQLNEWFEKEKKENGLVDFKVTLREDKTGMTVESVAKEIMEVLNAPHTPINDDEGNWL